MSVSQAVSGRATEIESFLDNLFENNEGFVYVPTKKPATGYWQVYFFSWPQQRTDIVTHILDATKTKDVYVAPSLFKESKKPDKSNWLGSNYVWVEFDGNAPDSLPDGIPTPTYRIQSSTKGHEHWYWKLPDFETNSDVIEGLAKRLTYTLEADLSGWDCTQVLRPPGTLHQESRRKVALKTANSLVHQLSDFVNLKEPPDPVIIDTSIDDIPDVQSVVAKFKWPEDAYDLFKKATQPKGSRSSAMTRLAMHCIEMGMSNEETYSILYNADDRWGKFKTRPPAQRAKRLLGIITYARTKTAFKAELGLSKRDPIYSFDELLNLDVKLDWLYKDFLPDQGFGIVSAVSGVGKSTFSIHLGVNIALGKDFLKWSYEMEEGKTVGFFSYEMGDTEVKQFLIAIKNKVSEDEYETLKKKFFVLPKGYAFPLWKKEAQDEFLQYVDEKRLDFIIIDSLKATTGVDERKMDEFFNFVNKELRSDRKLTVWLIHHNRKPAKVEGKIKDPEDLSELYGDTFIGAHATTVLALAKKGKGSLKVITLKNRHAEEADPFYIKHTKYRMFEIDDTKRTVLLGQTVPVAEEKTDGGINM